MGFHVSSVLKLERRSLICSVSASVGRCCFDMTQYDIAIEVRVFCLRAGGRAGALVSPRCSGPCLLLLRPRQIAAHEWCHVRGPSPDQNGPIWRPVPQSSLV